MHNSLPVLALLVNACIWGLSWWPFRRMLDAGLHPLWATALMYAAITAAMLLLRPAAARQFAAHRGLWLLAACAGITNVAFNWAITIGDVVRVVLLFYLMPAWAVLLAWRLLGERPTAAALLRLLLAFGGVVLVLWPAEGGAARLAAGLRLADALALLGGFMFALTNVTLRRQRAAPEQARMLAMFVGCMAMGWLAAGGARVAGIAPPLPGFGAGWLGAALALAALLMLGNWMLQYGAAHLPVGTTAVVLLSEVAFASGSSVLLGAAQPTAATWAGGALIVAAALLAALQRRR